MNNLQKNILELDGKIFKKMKLKKKSHLLQHAHPQLNGDICFSPLKTEHLIVYCMKYPYERQRYNMAQISMLCRP
jgi:hypothetical protein